MLPPHWDQGWHKTRGLLLDSRVVDVPMASNLIAVTLSSLKPLFFNGLKKVRSYWIPGSWNVRMSYTDDISVSNL